MKLDNLLENITLWGIYLVPFIPLVVTTDLFFPFITGKGFVFRILVGIILLLWIILFLRRDEFKPKNSILTFTILAFTLIVLIADIFGVNPERSLWSRFERMEGFVTIAHLFVYFLVAGSVLNTKERWFKFFNISIIGSLIMAFYGMLQLGGNIKINQGGVRLDGTLGNATYLAIYSVFHIFIGFILLLSKKNHKWQNYYYGIAILVNIFILYSTATRGAMLGLLGGAIISSILIFFQKRQSALVKKITVGIPIVILVLAGLFIAFKDAGFIRESITLNRFASISPTEVTTQSRFVIWGMAYEGFKDRPLLGWGQDNFTYVFNENYNPILYRQEPWFDRAHNVIFDWLVSAGALGLLSYISIFLTALYLIWRKSQLNEYEKSLITGLFAAYTFHNIFVFDQIVSYVFFFSFLAYIHSMSTIGKNSFIPDFKPLTRNIVVITSIVVILFGIYGVNYKAYAQSKTLTSALTVFTQNSLGQISATQPNGPADNLELYKKAIAYDSFGTTEARQFLFQTTGVVLRSDVPREIKIEFANLSIDEMFKEIEKDPRRAVNIYLLAQFLGNVGQYDEALGVIEKAIALVPEKQDLHITKASIFLQKGDLENAFKTAKFAYEIEESNNVAWRAYVTVSKRFDPVLFNSLVNEALESGQSDKVIQFAEFQIQTNPDEPESYIFLVNTYERSGRLSELVDALEVISQKVEGAEVFVRPIINDFSN